MAGIRYLSEEDGFIPPEEVAEAAEYGLLLKEKVTTHQNRPPKKPCIFSFFLDRVFARNPYFTRISCIVWMRAHRCRIAALSQANLAKA